MVNAKMKAESSRIIKKSLIVAAALQFLLIAASLAPAKAQVTVVSILPSSVTIANPGDTVTVDLNITDVNDLFGYEIMVFYMNSVVNITNAIRPTGQFLTPSDPANAFQAKWEVKNDFNATWGRLWMGYILLAPETGRTGSGILVEITFIGIAQATTPVILQNAPSGTQGPVKLTNSIGAPIAHTATDGSIQVIPELVVVMLAVIGISSIFAAVFARKYKRKPI